MTTLYVTHAAFLEHLTPAGHPERPDRLRAIAKRMADPVFASLERVDAPLAPIETALLAHDEDYVQALAEVAPHEGRVQIDADTSMSPGSMEAILRALGGALHATDRVMRREVANAFLAARPPGHHAESRKAMGFCFFNTAAIAARYAQKAHGAARVAIIDWDVHHGNGTQEIVWKDPSILYASTHQMPLYPGTGDPSETGAGNVFNVALEDGDGGPQFRAAFEGTIIPALDRFKPDFVIISAGFDAHRRDPLGGLRLDEADFVWATEALMGVADRHAAGRLLSILEGGYDLEGLSGSVAAHVARLMLA